MKLLAVIVVFVEFVIVAAVIIPILNLTKQPIILQVIVMVPLILAMRWTWRELSTRQLKPKKRKQGRYARATEHGGGRKSFVPDIIQKAMSENTATKKVSNVKGVNTKDWFLGNKTIIIVLILSVTAIIIVTLLRPPRYQKGGPNNNWILDTKSGRWITPYSH